MSGMRVLPSEGQQVYLEASFQGQGMLLGQPITDIGTYRQTMRGEALHGEGHVVMLASDGALADWVGGGVGKPTGPGLSASYGVYGSFQGATGALERLLSVATAIEYEVEQDSSYRWTLWQWAGAAGPS